MRVSQAGIDAIKDHEGLVLSAYRDVAGVLTIGYGHTRGIEEGQTITSSAADFLLRQDVELCEAAVNDAIRVPLTQGQFDACVSFTFNLGTQAFKDSTLLQKLNASDFAGAADEFPRWNKARINGELQPVAGLTTRRAAERAMFLSDTRLGPGMPRPDAEPYVTPERAMPFPIAPVITALAPAFLEMLPRLGKWFGSGSKVSERNLAVVGEAIKLAQTTTGAVNAMDAVDRMKADPAARAAVEAAVEQNWFVLTESGGGGIGGARAADAAAINSDGPWWQVIKSPSFVMACLLLPLVYLIVGNVVGLYGADWSTDARAGLSGSIAGGIVMGLIGYYYGQVTSKNRTPAP